MALSAPRSTAQYGGSPFGVLPETYVLPVEASTTIYQGSLVAVNASGNAIPAASAAGAVIGRCEVGNGGVSVNVATTAGSVSVTVRQGAFLWDMHGTAFTKANFGAVVFAYDDHTVELSGTYAAGIFVGLDSFTGTQAMVLTVLTPPAGTGSFTDVSASGTLGVTGLSTLASLVVGTGTTLSQVKAGQATLNGSGTVTVSDTTVTSGSIILLTPVGTGSAGVVNVGAIVASTSFVIHSSDASDSRVVNYLVIN